MHHIEPRVEGEPVAVAAEQEVDQSFSFAAAANQSDLEEGIQSNDGHHVAIVLNSVMRVSSALFEAAQGVVRSSSSSISGAETEIELEPYSKCSFCLGGDRALTHQAGDGSKPRDGISTAPTLHSRSSTPPGTRQGSQLARREDNSTSCGDGILSRWLESFQKFWNKHISVQVPGKAARDHLGQSISLLS